MSRQLNHLFASLTSDVVPGPPKQQGRRLRSTYRIEITNTMRVPVFWRNALGLVVSESSTPSTTAEERFYITIVYEFDPGVKIDARELLNELDIPENHSEREGIVSALHHLETEPQWQHQRTFSYTLGISREDLENAGGVAYLNDVDLVVGFEQHREAVLHPYSPPGLRKQLSEVLDPDQGFQQRYLLVDNAGILGSWWVNTGYDVFELRPVADPRYQDGVYVTVYHPRQEAPKTTYHELEDAQKVLGLYSNRAEAEAFGSPESRFKAELKETEQQIARDKVELSRQRQEMEREKHDREAERRREDDRRAAEQAEQEATAQREKDANERERDRLKLERERMEFERQTFKEKQKFEYDMRSQDRKDQSDQTKALLDMAKLILAITSTGLSLYAVIKKNQT